MWFGEALTSLEVVAEDESVVGLGMVGKLRQALWCGLGDLWWYESVLLFFVVNVGSLYGRRVVDGWRAEESLLLIEGTVALGGAG